MSGRGRGRGSRPQNKFTKTLPKNSQKNEPVTQEEFNKYLEQIRNNEILKLDLRGKYIRDMGIELLTEALKENSSLIYLVFGDNYIKDEELMSLAKVLEYNESLTCLSLRSNIALNENNKGIERSLEKAFKMNRSLTSLDLRDHQGGVRWLVEALKENKCLSYCHGKETEELKNLVDKNKHDNQNLAKIIKSEFNSYLEALLNKKPISISSELNLGELKQRAAAINYMLQEVDEDYDIRPDPEVVLFFNKISKKLQDGNKFNSTTQLFESSIKEFAWEINNGYYAQTRDYPGMYIVEKLRHNEPYKMNEEFIQKIKQIPLIRLYGEAIKSWQEEKYMQAFLNIQNVLADLPYKGEIILEKARILYSMEEYVEVEECLDKAIRSTDLNLEKSREIRDWFEKKRGLNKAIKLQNYILEKSNYTLDEYYRLANLYLENDQWIKALSSYNEINNLYPEQSKAYIEKAKLLYNKGFIEEFNKTIEEAENRVDITTENIKEIVNWLEERGDKAKAAQYYTKILGNDSIPGNYNHIADLHKQQGDFDGAAKILERQVSKIKSEEVDNVNLKKAYFELIEIYRVLENSEKQLEAYNQILELEPRNFNVHLEKGKLLVEQEEYDKALEEFDICAIINRRDVSPYIEKAKMYEIKEDREEALATLKQAYQFTGSEGRDKISSEIERINNAGEGRDDNSGGTSKDIRYDDSSKGGKEDSFDKTERVEDMDEYEMQYSIIRDAWYLREDGASEVGGAAASSGAGWNEVDNSTVDPNQQETGRDLIGDNNDYFGDIS